MNAILRPLALRSSPVWREATAPAFEPLTAAQLGQSLPLDHSEDDAELDLLIRTARQQIESDTYRLFAVREVVSYRDAWESPRRPHTAETSAVLELEPGPVQSIVSLEYLLDGVYQSVDSALYFLDAMRVPARLKPANGQKWPALDNEMNAVRITFNAGYSDIADIPDSFIRTVYFLAAHWYNNPEMYQQDGRSPVEVPRTYTALLDAMRRERV